MTSFERDDDDLLRAHLDAFRAVERPPQAVVDELAELGRHVAAYRSCEQPSPASCKRTLRAIRQKIPARSAWRRRAIACATGIAAAAALVLVVRGVIPLGEALQGDGAVTGHHAQLGRADDPSKSAVRQPVSHHRAPATVTPAPADAGEHLEHSSDPPSMSQPDERKVAGPETSVPNASAARKKPLRKALPTADDPAGLAAEVTLFESIQRALRRKQPAVALDHIREHARKFPHGAFVQERWIAEAEALCMLDRREQLDALRKRFLAAFSRSHLGSRMNAICAERAAPSAESMPEPRAR